MFGEIYQHDASNNYLVIEGKKEKYTDFADKILQENKVPGVLVCQYRYIDGKTYFYYRVNSLQSLSQVFARRKINWKELSHILKEIDRNWHEMESYLLNQDRIVLLPEYIFTDFDLEKVYFCYYPDYKEALSYEKLAAFFVDVVDYKDNKAVELAYGFHGQISEMNRSFSEIVSRLLSEKKEKEEVEKVSVLPEYESVFKRESEEDKESGDKKHLQLQNKFFFIGMGILIVEAVFFLGLGVLALYQGILLMIITIAIFAYILWNQRKKNTVEEEEFEMKLVEDEQIKNEETNYQSAEPIGQTVLLSRDLEIKRHTLIYQGNDAIKSFDLDVFPFVLGKAEKGIDGTILSSLVSRIHCQINYVNQEYTLQDLNSTNGTYLNGRLLTPREQVKIQPGDRIILANQPFLFQ